MEPVIHRAIVKLLDKLNGFGVSGQPVPLMLLYTALDNDIITAYSFWEILE
jgi:hypothetical protein